MVARRQLLTTMIALALALQVSGCARFGRGLPLAAVPPSDKLVVAVVDLANHGLAVVIQTPGRKTYVVDTGGERETVERFLRTQGITTLDGLVISHPHGDHYGGALSLLNRLQVKALILSPFDRKLRLEGDDKKLASARREIEQVRKIRGLAEQKGIRIREIGAGQILEWDPQLTVEVLWPPEEPVLGKNSAPADAFNPNSLVLRIQHGRNIFLLPGDLTGGAAETLIKEQPAKLKTDVLIVPHHGFFSSKRFAEATQARIAIASCIVDYRDHPTRNVPGINAVNLFAPVGAGVYVTAWHGQVRVESDGQDLRVTAERKVSAKAATKPAP